MRRVLARDKVWMLCAVLVLALIVARYVFWAGLHDEVDFGVYRAGGHAFAAGQDLYRLRVPPIGLPFTYPPAAAVLFAPFSWLPIRSGQVLWMAASLAGLYAFVWLTLRRYAVGVARRSLLVLMLVVGVVAWSDPLKVGLDLGQINVLIALLVVADLAGALPWIPRGALIGIAAALKLTPLFLICYFVAVRRYRAACVATGAFVAVSATAFLLGPHASTEYWFHGYFGDPRRTGGISYVSNQSLYGTIVRLTGGPLHVRFYWLPAVIVVGGVVLWAARRLHSDRPWLAESLAMAAILLISPVSWVHHWILVLPFLVSCVRLYSEAPRLRFMLGATLALSAAVALGAIWWVPNNNGREYRHNTWQFLVGNSDVLLLLITIAAALAATLWLEPGRADRQVGASLRRME